MENIIIPSGGFYYGGMEYPPFRSVGDAVTYVSEESPLYGQYIIYNPMVVAEIPLERLDTVNLEDAEILRAETRGLRQITTEEMDAYARALIRVHDRIRQQNPQAVLFPLRGGLKPGLQLEVMTNFDIQPIWLPYTGAGGGGHEAEIRRALADALAVYETQTELTLSIVDTAISGHSAERLAQYLRDWIISGQRRLNLRCFMNILFSSSDPSHSYPSRVNSIPPLNSESVSFTLFLDDVPSLLVEDWSEAIGWKVEYAGGVGILKPSVRAGEMLLKTGDRQFSYLRSDRLDMLVDSQVARAISEQIITDPSRRWAFDVWQEYTDR